MRKGKRILSALLTAVMSVSILASCGSGKKDNRVTIEPGDWVHTSESAESKQKWEDKIVAFEKKYPDIKVKGGNIYRFDTQTFNAKAAAGQLPTFLAVPYTEYGQMSKNGYTSDITKALKDNNILDKINPDILEILTDDKGAICGMPDMTYVQGLLINKEIFKKAGLADENGMPKVPNTWQELAEYAKIIKEKTGIAGFSIPTTNNCGGWIFLNIAWSYGVNFEEQQANGKWKAIFDTQEFRDALQFLYDLRWKYDVFPDNKVIDATEYQKVFYTKQAAMIITGPDNASGIVTQGGLNKDDIFFAKMPKGPAGRYSQMGGAARVFFSKNSEEQNDAAVKWLMEEGYTPFITPEIEKNIRTNCENTIEKGGIVFPKELFSQWESEDRKTKIEKIYGEYANVDIRNYENYMDFSDVIIRPEEAVLCQQLYSILDNVIQEIMTKKDADIDALAKSAAENFQKNHLDKME